MKFSAYRRFKTSRSVQSLFEVFRRDRFPFLLESGRNTSLGRYSYFGSDPFLIFRHKNGRSNIRSAKVVSSLRDPDLAVLRKLLKKYELSGSLEPFLCGAVGFFSYDHGFSIEKIKRKNKPDPVVPDIMLAFYDTVVRFDHFSKEVLIFSSGFPELGIKRKTRADKRLLSVSERISQARMPDACGFPSKIELVSNFSKKEYSKSIKKIKEYITRGDIYQVNLAQKFSSKSDIDAWEVYRRLAHFFPVDFAAYFDAGDFSIMSASPEKFLKFDGRIVSTRPMKGTRPRGLDKVLDRLNRQELFESKKEKAELLMITDLERNDLGRVCEYGSIKVACKRRIETYKGVFQATAEITGELKKDKDRLDLIQACFPGGSITGAPKIRAMEIIEELEPCSRSIYTGAFGYLSFHNTLEFSILIRSFLKKGKELSFHAG
ncbi:MAG TPA: anthranilate synthase component I family protein, partial [Candidatus Omnitrophota bacterium]|nr:anthranilate synthase component I family protein [Candidatus Omnitrophota bacterium]